MQIIYLKLKLKVLSSGQHLLTRGSEEDCVFVLRHVRSLYIHERGVGGHQSHIAEVLQGGQIHLLLALRETRE
jgi:hypothetical protein